MLLLLATFAAGACALELRLPPGAHVTVVESVTPVLRWVSAPGECDRGFDVSQRRPRLAVLQNCPSEMLVRRPFYHPYPFRRRYRWAIRRAARGRPSAATLLGDYRQITVRELANTLRSAPGIVQDQSGQIVYALSADWTMREIDRGSASRLLCDPNDDALPGRDPDPQIVDWMPPPPWHDRSAILASENDPSPELRASMERLHEAVFQAMQLRDRGGAVRRLSEFRFERSDTAVGDDPPALRRPASP